MNGFSVRVRSRFRMSESRPEQSAVWERVLGSNLGLRVRAGFRVVSIEIYIYWGRQNGDSQPEAHPSRRRLARKWGIESLLMRKEWRWGSDSGSRPVWISGLGSKSTSDMDHSGMKIRLSHGRINTGKEAEEDLDPDHVHSEGEPKTKVQWWKPKSRWKLVWKVRCSHDWPDTEHA